MLFMALLAREVYYSFCQAGARISENANFISCWGAAYFYLNSDAMLGVLLFLSYKKIKGSGFL
jgi:hypothetical protein